MHVKTISLVLTALAAFSISSNALAYGKGDFFFRIGVAKIKPLGSDATINIDNVVSKALERDKIKVDSKTNAAFSLGYLFTDKFGIELLAAPQSFKHDIHVITGSSGTINGSVRHLPPTLTLQYYPLGGTTSQVQPYFGAGINYTHFSSEYLDVADIKLNVKNSTSFALQAGVDYQITKNIAANLGIWYLDINPKAHITAGGKELANTKLHIRPIVAMAGLTFRF